MRRYEIYLPLKYNDGTDIEIEKFEIVEKELLSLFGGLTASSSLSPLEGVWRHQDIQYRDKIVRFEIITESDKRIESFFKEYKETLKKRFRQKEVFITVHDIKTI